MTMTAGSFGPARPSRRLLLMRFGLPFLVLLAGAGTVLGLSARRVNAVTCTLVTQTGIVIRSGAESEIRITRDASSPIGDPFIKVNGLICGTLKTVDAIDVQGSTGTERLIIDQTNGRFVDPGNGSEILFTGNLGSGDPDSLVVIGRGAADDITFGRDGTTGALRGTLNADNKTEITLGSLEAITADVRGGADRVSGQGTNSAGLALSPADVPMTLIGGPGDDVLIGGSAADTLSYAGVSSPVLVDMGAGTATGELIGDDTYSLVETIVGGSSNDTFIDDPAVCDRVFGGPGNDRFVALNRPGGEDCVTPTSDGGDFFDGGSGHDTYDASDVPANSPGVTFDFLNKIVHGSGTDDCVNCENGDGSEAGGDTFIDDPAKCNVFNGKGDDDTFVAVNRPGTEEGGTCGDTFDGGEGTDTYDASDVPANSPGVTFDFLNKIVHGSGEDECIDCENGLGTEAGDDVFIDDPNVCNVFGGQGGDDTFVAKNRPGTEEGGNCGDTFDGGEGGETNGDTYDASDVPANSPGVTFDFLNKIVHGSGEDECIDCENGEGSVGDDVFIDEDNSCNAFNGNAGDDLWIAGVQRPGSEQDPSKGAPCGDIVDMGDGGEVEGDTLDYGNTEANSPGVIIDLINGIVSGSPQDVARRAENAFGSEHDDVIIGTEGFNKLQGRGGDDVIITNGGGDEVDGGEGNDTIDGVPEEPAETPGIYCNLEEGVLIVDGETTHGVTECEGGPGDDILIGGDGDDVLLGHGGNDRIEGRGGNDEIHGGDGDDDLDGGNGDDVVFGDAGNDTISGGTNGADELHGGSGDDTIDGGNGNDMLFGDEGDDTLLGGPGSDFLDGGDGEEDGGRADRPEPGDFGDGGSGSDSCVRLEFATRCESEGAS